MTHNKATGLLVLHVPPRLAQRLERVANIHGITASDVARNGILALIRREESRLDNNKNSSSQVASNEI